MPQVKPRQQQAEGDPADRADHLFAGVAGEEVDVQVLQPQQDVVVGAAHEQGATVFRGEVAATAVFVERDEGRHPRVRQLDRAQPGWRFAFEDVREHCAIGVQRMSFQLRLLPTQQVLVEDQHRTGDAEHRERDADAQSDPQVQPRQQSSHARAGPGQNRSVQLAVSARPRPAL